MTIGLASHSLTHCYYIKRFQFMLLSAFKPVITATFRKNVISTLREMYLFGILSNISKSRAYLSFSS